MKPLIAAEPPLRGSDTHGAGHYGAPRGTRRHTGIDYAAAPGAPVLAPCMGTITKLGHPYADDLRYRYIQITDDVSYDVRLFYVEPVLPVGARVKYGDIIGYAQDLNRRYPGITSHIHLEIKDADGEHIDPDKY